MLPLGNVVTGRQVGIMLSVLMGSNVQKSFVVQDSDVHFV